MISPHQLISQVGYTPLVFGRINRKLGTDYHPDQIKSFVINILIDPQTTIQTQGKNYYLNNQKLDVRLTINRHSFRVITADRYDPQHLLPVSKNPPVE